MFSRKHREFGFFFSWRHDVTDWSHCFFRDSLDYIYILFSHKTFNQNASLGFFDEQKFCTEKKWELGHWSRESEKQHHLDFGPEWWTTGAEQPERLWQLSFGFFFSEITVIFITVLIISLVFDRLQLFFRRSSPFLFCHCCSSVKFQSATF